ncbi:hypothetical protein TNCT_168601 [Trichonephila clavata]|uniref:Uncharacterized protein n=1 Tax=Trichonephila clavata TaxID=2740835 RepID=A0A8X6KQC1_TRICU|nr:hypothetical protein TNCT_168601 [Trichonephila clavata]
MHLRYTQLVNSFLGRSKESHAKKKNLFRKKRKKKPYFDRTIQCPAPVVSPLSIQIPPLLGQTQPPAHFLSPPQPILLPVDSFNLLPVPPVFPPYWSHTAESSASIIHRACAVASYRSIVVEAQGSQSS